MAQFTKRAIVESFLKLLNQKPLDKITVKEIVDDCGINRNTFYYHFEDIRALLAFVVDAEVEQVITDNADVESLEEGFIEGAKFALTNRRAVYHIYNSVNSDELDRYLNGMAEEIMRRLVDKMDIDKSVSNTDKELIIHFYKYGMVGMMKAWVSEGMKADPEQLIRSIGDLLDGTVAATLNRSRERSKTGQNV